VYSQYKFYDMQKDDIVLDIGANVGAFSIFISNTVKQVYAVEPALPNVLKHNIKLNNIKNITVFEKALGDGELNIEWRGKHKISGNSLAEIIELCGGHIDVLKCDCEGGEWCIKSPELKGIRRIEMEVHNFEGKHNFEDYLKMLSDAGFLYEYQITSKQIMLIHAESSAVF
ncbi:MAG TPA: FkbM family methyltransferase, partial [Candidatus Methylomirabilis sp.]|nr:FkbM family methyltransferase [Candidatus Methylomirabilis sp.]